MERRFRRRKYRLGLARDGVLRRAEPPAEAFPAPDDEEEWGVRLPRRRVLPSVSEHAEPDSFRPDPILLSPEGESSAGNRRRLL